jgi:hypothetical protein
MKYLVVTGGVVSGLGKGISISSLGVLLKAAGLRVTAIKIDPYLVCYLPPLFFVARVAGWLFKPGQKLCPRDFTHPLSHPLLAHLPLSNEEF